MLLECRRLSFGYAKPLAKPLDFAVDGGQVVALLGENGSGKSTLLKTFAGMLLPLEGSLELDGQPVAAYGLRELARKVALVRMGLLLPDQMTVEEFVSLGRSPYAGVLDGRSTEDGERSRVYLARALAQRVKLLLLDEPDAFMDIPRRKNLFVTLQRLSREKGMAVVLSTHWVGYAEKYADKILCFGKGSVVEAPAAEARKLGLLDWAEV